MAVVTGKDLHYLEYVNREHAFTPPTYDDDMLQYEYLKQGNPEALELGRRLFDPAVQGRISEDDLRNVKYLFVASITLACRFAIAGGVDQRLAYNASTLYIQRMDACDTVDKVISLHHDMFAFYTRATAEVPKQQIFSLPVVQCIDYIYHHLNEPLPVAVLAEQVGLNASYLSTLFRRETGYALSDYIRRRRVDTACNMLKYSSYTCSQIAAVLAFSSQSHFTKVFREQTGLTPKEYRRRHHMHGTAR